MPWETWLKHLQLSPTPGGMLWELRPGRFLKVLPSLKLTVRTWITGVGSDEFPLGWKAYFQVRTVSFREGTPLKVLYHLESRWLATPISLCLSWPLTNRHLLEVASHLLSPWCRYPPYQSYLRLTRCLIGIFLGSKILSKQVFGCLGISPWKNETPIGKHHFQVPYQTFSLGG